MKAIVQDKYGSPEVLELRDIDPPDIGLDDVLVRVRAAGVHIGDWHLMTGQPYAPQPSLPSRLFVSARSNQGSRS